MDIVSKTRRDYNKIAPYFAASRNNEWPEFVQFKPFLRSGQRVLDWGCANGRLVPTVLAMGSTYVGLDQSDKLIAIAKKEYKKEIAQKKVQFFCTATKEKVFERNSFDIVCMVASFHHLPTVATRRALLKKTFKELKPSGMLLMTNWNLENDWAKSRRSAWKKLAPNDYLIPWKTQQGKIVVERYYHYFSKLELRTLVTAAGFRIDKLDYAGETGEWSDKKDGRNLVLIAHKP